MAFQLFLLTVEKIQRRFRIFNEGKPTKSEQPQQNPGATFLTDCGPAHVMSMGALPFAAHQDKARTQKDTPWTPKYRPAGNLQKQKKKTNFAHENTPRHRSARTEKQMPWTPKYRPAGVLLKQKHDSANEKRRDAEVPAPKRTFPGRPNTGPPIIC
jgi:hypothetical protein